MKEHHWYTFCKKHLKMNYRPRKDGWCKASKGVIAKYPCGIRSLSTGFCKNKVYAEFYPNLLALARESKEEK